MMLSGFNKYRITALFLLGSLLLLAQCKRSEEPFKDTIKGSPVFNLKGTVNGQPFQWIAGVDSYYMYTSYTYDNTNQAYAYTGTLKRTNCDTCKESIQITIYDSLNNNGSTPVNILLALQSGNRQYYFPQTSQQYRYKYQFKSEIEYFLSPSYLWTFNGGDSSIAANPVVYFSDTNTKNVCLKVTDASTLCTKTICNNITPPKAIYTDFIKPDFTYDTLAFDSIQFFNTSYSPASANYFWDFGDGNQSSDSAPRHRYLTNGRYQVSLTMTAPVYGSQTIEKNVAFKDFSTDCLVNYSYDTPVPDTVSVTTSILSKVVIRYIDATGEVFVSDRQAQPLTSQFNILSNVAYEANERGDKTRSLGINFVCRVYSTTTASFKDIVVSGGIIAIAYP